MRPSSPVGDLIVCVWIVGLKCLATSHLPHLHDLVVQGRKHVLELEPPSVRRVEPKGAGGLDPVVDGGLIMVMGGRGGGQGWERLTTHRKVLISIISL